MLIIFTRLDDRRHALEVVRGDGGRERVELETRSCLLHDLVHLAVEEAAGIEQGFWGSLASGRTFDELKGGEGEGSPASELMMQVERAVAVLQGMVKAGADPAAAHARITAMLAIQGGKPPPWFTEPLVVEVFERMRRLMGHWKATPRGADMVLTWGGGEDGPPAARSGGHAE